MATKILGYVLALLGIIGIIVSGEGAQKALALRLPAALSGTTPLIAGIVLAALGILLALKGAKSKQPEEVPIYEGKNVVGYRRMKK